MATWRRFLLGLGLLASAGLVHAEPLVVIVHPQAGVTTLTRAEAVNIFMGRSHRLPSGIIAYPVDLSGDSPLRSQFYQRLLQRTPAEVDAYWAHLIFSGDNSPPMKVPTPAMVVELVATNRNVIGFVEASLAGPSVKVVLTLNE